MQGLFQARGSTSNISPEEEYSGPEFITLRKNVLLVWMDIGKHFNMETKCYRKIFILKMIFIIASHTDVCSGKTEFENRLMFRNLEVRDVDKNELYCDNNFQGISGHYTNIVLTKY